MNQSKNEVMLTLRITKEMLKTLNKNAKFAGLSRSAYIKFIINVHTK